MTRCSRRGEAAAAVIVAALLILAPASSARAQLAVVGGYNSILGVYLSAGRILSIAPGTDLVLGVAYAQTTGTDPLVTLTVSRPLRAGWTASFEATYAGLGGDYRVDRLPEAILARSGRIGESLFTYGLEAGAGFYRVRPPGISGTRAYADVRLGTVAIPLGSMTRVTAEAGYRQYAYPSGMHGAGWGKVQLALAPSPDSLLSVTYVRQAPTGASPLLFDALSDDHGVAGSIAVRPAPWLILTHSQSYSFRSAGISERIYRLSIEAAGHALMLSWDQVAQTATLRYRWSGP